MHRRELIRGMAVLSWLPATLDGARAADSPGRAVRLVVPYGAGNATDQLARTLAEPLSRNLGERLIVDNLPGVGGTLGTGAVARAAPDGLTLGLVAMAALAITPHLLKVKPYDPLRDFVPIATVAVAHAFLAVHPSVPATTLAEFVAHARARRASPLFYYSAGSGTVAHLNMEVLRRALDFPAEHTPFRTSAAGLTDLVAGRVQATMDAASVTLPQIRAGGLRALAYTGPRRHPALPDVPTMAEAAPGLELSSPWLGFIGPRDLDPTPTKRMAEAVRPLVDAPDFPARLPLGLEVLTEGPEAFASRLRRDHARFGQLIAELGLEAE